MSIKGRNFLAAWLAGVLIYMMAAVLASPPDGGNNLSFVHVFFGFVASTAAIGVVWVIGLLTKPLLSSKYWSNGARLVIATVLVPVFLITGSNLSSHNTPEGSPGDSEVEDIETVFFFSAMLSYVGLVF